MKKRLDFNLDNIREYAVHIFVFLALLVLALKVLFPQVENIAANRMLLVESNSKLETLSARVKFLESLDKTTNRQKLQRLSFALPPEKDVGLMLDALERIAARSNLRLGDLTLAATAQNSKLGIPEIQVTLNLRGGILDLEKFVAEAERTLPIVQVRSVLTREASSTIVLSFYFKPVKTGEVAKQASWGATKISKSQEEVFAKILEREAPSIIFLESESQPTGGRTDPFR